MFLPLASKNLASKRVCFAIRLSEKFPSDTMLYVIKYSNKGTNQPCMNYSTFLISTLIFALCALPSNRTSMEAFFCRALRYFISSSCPVKNPPQVILSPSTVNGDGSITSPPLESHCIISASCAGSGVDEDVGVAASIRIVNAQKLKKEDFLRSGTAADEMMELMSALVRYGVSTTVAGATSSGKPR